MQRKTSPIFQAFEQQHREAKELFLALGKQIKSKKSIELYNKLSFLELYSDLMAKVHFEKEGLQFDLFSPFKTLQKNLRKIHHLKLVERGIRERIQTTGETYNSYAGYLDKSKKGLYTETFDQIIGSSLKDWDELLLKSQQSSKNIKPLTVNTAINQLIQEELEYFQLDKSNGLDSKALKDIFEGLRKIIMLENLLIHLGFNSIFVDQIHDEISELKEKLKPWYANHLELQSLTYFLSDKEQVSKKYVDWVKELRHKKKNLSSQVEKQALTLFQKILD
ncbi:hypothetical protein [Algoriphagus hitonicola]|uniref:CHAD domain-containing protein n=1 Tax=Algoriphagus hitonicola TaxID=435880 RepID=A0A1I2NY36_9BACT|nr:hypothetical protein [Algoriphagus hitonicola]SFG07980.1 hypothetical protein SAMN04487988_101334 [Algoriphagus hitonicola]